MARKSKRMALNDAIRQGQAKIADGTGQMRSDDPSAWRAEKGLSSPENATQKPVNKCRAFFLKSEEKSTIWGQFPPKMKLIALLCATSIVVLSLGIWLISLLRTDQSLNPEFQGTSVANSVSEENGQTSGKSSLSDFDGDDSSESADSVSEKRPLLSSRGDNVICIQSIAFDRKEELGPLADFFRHNGIETKAGFEENPVKEGTDGYKLVQRIRQIGPVYVEETKDTKFGVKPFQDVYGRKR
ncbi:MAG: hypothetical protein ACYSUS_09985 [Planctomycetota bacterium]|jgi:hypothetical protein